VSDENPLESFPTTDAIPVVSNPRPKKAGGGKKKKAPKKTRRAPWHLVLFAELCPTLITAIKTTLAESGGVRSLADLHRTFEKNLNCTIDRDTFDNAVFMDDTLAALFNKPNLITLPTASTNLNPQKQTPDSSFGPGARTSLMVLDDPEDPPPGTLDIDFKPIFEALGDHGSTPAAGGAAASSPWVPPPDPMAVQLDRSGRPVSRI
jgi:hypothetical protein